MSEDMYYYKNAKIEPASNGYILSYDKYSAGGECYGSMRFIDCVREVYEGEDAGKSAITAMDKITGSKQYASSMEIASKSVRADDD